MDGGPQVRSWCRHVWQRGPSHEQASTTSRRTSELTGDPFPFRHWDLILIISCISRSCTLHIVCPTSPLACISPVLTNALLGYRNISQSHRYPGSSQILCGKIVTHFSATIDAEPLLMPKFKLEIRRTCAGNSSRFNLGSQGGAFFFLQQVSLPVI